MLVTIKKATHIGSPCRLLLVPLRKVPNEPVADGRTRSPWKFGKRGVIPPSPDCHPWANDVRTHTLLRRSCREPQSVLIR